MTGAPLVHGALLYRSEREYVEGIGKFTRELVGAGAPVLIAVPGRKLDLLRDALAEANGNVEYADMTSHGGNPARILPFVLGFVDAHSARSAGFVTEPIWPGRTDAEIVEGVRHEALLNEALASTPVNVLCPYDARALDAGVIADVCLTHPTVVLGGTRHPSTTFADPLPTYAATGIPLPEPTAIAVDLPLGADLAAFRGAVEAHARLSGIGAARTSDLVLAANEAAANTLIHGCGDAVARVWHDAHELVCELSNRGAIGDPFAGRRTPSLEREGGRGLWMINQLCDLVEVRTDASTTVVRLHMRVRE